MKIPNFCSTLTEQTGPYTLYISCAGIDAINFYINYVVVHQTYAIDIINCFNVILNFNCALILAITINILSGLDPDKR